VTAVRGNEPDEAAIAKKGGGRERSFWASGKKAKNGVTRKREEGIGNHPKSYKKEENRKEKHQKSGMIEKPSV